MDLWPEFGWISSQLGSHRILILLDITGWSHKLRFHMRISTLHFLKRILAMSTSQHMHTYSFFIYCYNRCFIAWFSWYAFFGKFTKLRKATISFVMSVRPSAWNNSAPTGRIFMKFDIWLFFENSVGKVQVSINSDKNNRYLTWRPIYIFDHISLNSSWNEKRFTQKM